MDEQSSFFEQVYTQYHEPIVRYMARLVTPADAEDLTQEIFSKVAKHLDGFEGRSKLSTWIYRIATNVALDRLRGSRSRSIEIPLLEGVDAAQLSAGLALQSNSGALARVIDSEMNDCIHQQMEKLPSKYRTVMVLSSLEELRNREIAEILEISLEAVKMRLHRGRAKLKEILEKECRFYHHAGSGALLCDRKQPDRS